MLNQFSWLQFFLCALAGGLLWQLLIFVVYFKGNFPLYRSVVLFQNSAKEKLRPADHRPPRPDSGPQNSAPEVMGGSRPSPGLSRLSLSEVSFSLPQGKQDQQGLIPDLLQEIKKVFKTLSNQDGTKSDFLKAMEQAAAEFPGMASHPQISSVNAFLIEHAPFLLSSQEVEGIWE
ncbi:hypothetical protein [Pedobacter sp. SYP-B3415]|uniref:hypothetical protein n=1 Tax=Pedobacter sp. SYP-B3415 TaxID=2496641 RepID=UPI00101CD03F|nr:hypothetical protein [Pedobacter sp. SYP-B3415]